MKILIITAAGISSRFSESIGHPALKCIYYENDIKESLLYKMLHHNIDFDKYIIVGGFMYEELRATINTYFSDLLPNISLINNDKYRDYGSGYSLYLGLKEAVNLEFDELVFAEGDLFVDEESFQKLYDAEKDVITCNGEDIYANNAVAFYFDHAYTVHYIYDTAHEIFIIKEPFRGIFNSGQIWKFKDRKRLENIIFNLREEEKQGTNLVIVQKYFSAYSKEQYEIIKFNKWINCNMISDFYKINEENQS